MPATEELEVLQTVVRRLEKAGMPYMVTGSIAANFYAVPRMTRDIDVVIELSDRDVERFIGLFQKDFYLEPETVRAATRDKAMFNLIHNEYVLKIDFVVRKDSDYRRKEFSRRQKVSVDHRSFYVVSPEDLILSKLDWAKDSQSEAQLSDVRNLLKSVRGLNRRRIPLPQAHDMKDTSPADERKFRDLLLRRSGEQRLKMGCSMHSTARALVRASVLEKNPSASRAAIRKALFQRFYGDDFSPSRRKKILRSLEKS